MRALMNIFNRESPSLNKYENWSPEFRAFVDDCLIKDPNQRIASEDILAKHKKFFSKARDKAIIRFHLLEGRKPFIERIPPKVKQIGEQHFKKMFEEQTNQNGIGRSVTPRPAVKEKIKWIFDDPENESSTDTFEKTPPLEKQTTKDKGNKTAREIQTINMVSQVDKAGPKKPTNILDLNRARKSMMTTQNTTPAENPMNSLSTPLKQDSNKTEDKNIIRAGGMNKYNQLNNSIVESEKFKFNNKDKSSHHVRTISNTPSTILNG